MSQLLQFYKSFQQARAPVAKTAPTFEDLTIDDKLSEHQRVVRYSKSTIGLQRLVHVKMLADVAESVGFIETAATLIPLLEPLSKDVEPVVKQHLVEQLKKLAKFCTCEGGEEGYKAVINHILPITARLLEDEKVEVRHSASMTLVSIAPLLTPDDIGQYVLTIVLRLAHEDDKEDMRMTASQLLNLLAETLGHDYCKQFVIPEVVSLSEDPVFRVRKSAALNFHSICKVGGEHELLERLMPAFVRLSKDDMYRVRRACAESLTDISKNVSDDVRLGVLVEIFLRLTQDPSRMVKQSILQQSGTFIATLPSLYVSGTILQHYCSMIYYPTGDISMDAELRQICAFCFPAVLLTIGKDRWGEVREVYKTLTQSRSAGIKQTLAHSLHEVALILNDPQLVEEELVAVFEDMIQGVEPVQMGVIKHLATFLGMLPELCRVSFLPLLHDILHSTNPFNWRLRESLAVQLPELAKLPKKSELYHTLFPLILVLLQDPVASVRVASFPGVTSLMVTLYELSQPDSKKDEGDIGDEDIVTTSRHHLEYLAKSINSFAMGEKHQLRQLWVELCHRLLWDLPRHLFECYFIEGILLLTRDRVTNVRITVSSFLAGWEINSGAIHARTPVVAADPSQSPKSPASGKASPAASSGKVNLAAVPAIQDTPYEWLLARPDIQECIARLAEDDVDVYLNMKHLEPAFPHLDIKAIRCRGLRRAPGGNEIIDVNPPLKPLWTDGLTPIPPAEELSHFINASGNVSDSGTDAGTPAGPMRSRGGSRGSVSEMDAERKGRSNSGVEGGGLSLYKPHSTVSTPVFSSAEEGEGEELSPKTSNLEEEFMESNKDNLHLPATPPHYVTPVLGGYPHRNRSNSMDESAFSSEISQMELEMDKIDGIFIPPPTKPSSGKHSNEVVVSPHPLGDIEVMPPIPPESVDEDFPAGLDISPVDISRADVSVLAEEEDPEGNSAIDEESVAQKAGNTPVSSNSATYGVKEEESGLENKVSAAAQHVENSVEAITDFVDKIDLS